MNDEENMQDETEEMAADTELSEADRVAEKIRAALGYRPTVVSR